MSVPSMTRLTAKPSLRGILLVVAAAVGLVAACTEGRLPTQAGGGLTPSPVRLTLNATVSSAGRSMKVLTRYAKASAPTVFIKIDSTTIVLSGTETAVPVQLNIAACLADAERELAPGLTLEQSATTCVLHLVLALVDASDKVIDVATLPPIIAKSGEQATAPSVSLGIQVGKVILAPKAGTINAIGFTGVLTATVLDKSSNPIAAPSLAFTSLSPAIATVDSVTGIVTAKAVGVVRVVATSRDQSDTSVILVRQVAKTLVVTAPSSLLVGDSTTVTAQAKDSANVVIPDTAAKVVFTSSDSTVARVNPSSGRLRAVGAGSASVTGTSGPALTLVTVLVKPVPVAKVVVLPASATVYIGRTVTLVAQTQDSVGGVLAGRPIAWTSSDTTVATVSVAGVVTALKAGTATVTGSAEGKSAASVITAALVPVKTITIAPASSSLLVGQTTTLVATTKDSAGAVLTGRAITWVSSDTTIAVVSATGVVTARKAGSATIGASSEGKGTTASLSVADVPVSSVTITPTSAALLVGQQVLLAAVTKDSAGGTLTGRVVTWTSNDTSVAVVDATGRVLGKNAGAAIVTATSEGKSSTASINVSLVPVRTVTVTPNPDTVGVSLTRTLTVALADSAGGPLSGRPVTWVSSDTTKATVSPSGVVSGRAVGSVTITATSEGKSGTATMVVTLVTFPAGRRAWVGGISTDWHNPANWSPANVPTSSDSVEVLGGAPRFPVLLNHAFAARMLLGAGASLANGVFDLTVGRGMISTGAHSGTGFVRLLGGASQFAGTLGSLELRGLATATLTGGLSLTGNLIARDTSALVLGGHRLGVNSLTVQDRSTLSLTNAADTLDVAGATLISTAASLSGKLTAGAIRMAGDFSPAATFVSTGTRLVANGTANQFWPTGSATLSDVELRNSLATGTGVFIYNGTTVINGTLTQFSGSSTIGDNVLVSNGVALQAGHMAVSAGLSVNGGTLTTAIGSSLDGTGSLRLRDTSGTNGIGGTFGVALVELAPTAKLATGLKSGLGYQNVALSGGGQVTLGAPVSLTGTLTLNDSTQLALGGRKLVATTLNTNGTALLSMTSAADTIDLSGSVSMASTASLSGRLTAGVMRVGGGLNAGATFQSSGTRLVATGAGDQFWPMGGATLQDLVIANTASSGNGLYLYNGSITISGSVSQASGISNMAGAITTAGTTTASGGTMSIVGSYSASGRFTTAPGITLAGGGSLVLGDSSGTNSIGGPFGVSNLTFFSAARQQVGVKPSLGYANVTFQGGAAAVLSGPVTVAANLVLNDSSAITLNGRALSAGSVNVNALSTITLTNPLDTMYVAGQLNMTGTVSHTGRLTSGAIRVAGGFVNSGTFVSTGTRMVATGAGDQFWAVGGATFKDVDIENTAVTGNGLYLYNGAIHLTGALTQKSGIGNLAGALTIDGPLNLQAGRLSVSGSADLTAGRLTTAPLSVLDGAGSLILRDTSGTIGVAGSFAVTNLTVAVPGKLATNLKNGLGYSAVTLSGGSQVSLLGNITLVGSLTLSDSSNLTLAGRTVTTPTVNVNAKSTVTMTSVNDSLAVSNQLNFSGTTSHSGRLTAGVMVLAGGLTATSGTLVSTGTKVVATGAGDQFWPIGGSTLQDVTLSNTAATGNGAYLYNGNILVNGNLTQTSGISNMAGVITVNGAYALQGATSVMTIPGTLDLTTSRLTTAAGTTLNGLGTLTVRDTSGTNAVAGSFGVTNLVLDRGLRQNVALKPGLGYVNVTAKRGTQLFGSGTPGPVLSMSGTLTLNDSSNFSTGGRRVSVKDLTTANTATFGLGTSQDTLDLAGNFAIGSIATLSGRLTGGVMRITGGFSGNAAQFVATGTKVIASGSADQLWAVGSATFYRLTLSNTAATGNGVFLYNGPFTVSDSLVQTSGISTFNAIQDTTSVRTISLQAGTMNLASGADLSLRGSRFVTAPGTTVTGPGILQLRDTLGTNNVGGAFSVTNLVLKTSGSFASSVGMKAGLGYQNVTVQGNAQVTMAGNTSVTALTVKDTASFTLGGKKLTAGSISTLLNGAVTLSSVNDSLDVTGAANFASPESGRLTAGVMRIAGNLTTNGPAVFVTGTKLVANGSATQTWTAGGSTFKDVELSNSSLSAPGVILGNSVRLSVGGKLTQTGGFSQINNVTVTDTVNVLGTSSMDINAIDSVVFAKRQNTAPGTAISGTSNSLMLHDTTGTNYVAGTLSLSNITFKPSGFGVVAGIRGGLGYGNVTVAGQTQGRVNGSFTASGLLTVRDTAQFLLLGKKVGAQNMQVLGNATFTMTSLGDTLDVLGNVTYNSIFSENGKLTQGAIRIGGNLTTNGANFASTGTTVIATGSGVQSWSVPSSTFKDLVSLNTSTSGAGWSLTAAASVTVSGDYHLITGRATNAAGSTVNTATITIDAGTLLNNLGTFTRTGAKTVSGTVTGNPLP